MSEQRCSWSRLCIAAGLAVTLPLAMPAQAENCRALISGFELCDAAWQDARRVDLSEGLALDRDPEWLEVFGLPAELQTGLSLDDLLMMLEAENAEDEGYEPTEFISRTTFETEHLEVAALTSLVDMGGGTRDYMVVMVAEAKSGGQRIIVTLDPGTDSSAERSLAESRALVAAIRPAAGG